MFKNMLVLFISFLACSTNVNSRLVQSPRINTPKLENAEKANFKRPPPPPKDAPITVQRMLGAGSVIKITELKLSLTLPKPLGKAWLVLMTNDSSIFDDSIRILDHPADIPVISIKGFKEPKSAYNFVAKMAFGLAENNYVCTPIVPLAELNSWLTFDFQSVPGQGRPGPRFAGQMFVRPANTSQNLIVILAMWPADLAVDLKPLLLELIKGIVQQ